MLHHVEIYVSELDASRKFWVDILTQVGWRQSGSWNDGFTLANDDGAYLTFVQASEKYSGHSYHRCGVGLNHLAFRVESRIKVDELREYCIRHKISNLYDERYPFANGGADYYALFVEDPDRIKVEFVAST